MLKLKLLYIYSNNEEQLIEIFKDIKPDDWVLHMEITLSMSSKGVPPEQVKQDILKGKSITLCYPSHNIYSSAIVTGNIPIANGVLDIKRKGSSNHVWCFVGT